jgi:Tol biopolymer transport system component
MMGAMQRLSTLGMIAALGACGSVKSNPDGPPIDNAPPIDMPIDAPHPSLNQQHVVFSAIDANNVEQIFSIRLDGTDKRQITHEAQQTLFGTVSPDGTKVAFTTTIGNNEDIFLINIDGTGRRPLTTNAASDFRPVFSADGTKIAFCSSRDVAAFNVYVMTVAQGDAGQVTRVSPSANQQEFPSMGGANKVGWTEALPVGTSTQQEVMSANADGTGVTNLTNSPAADFTSAYSRDGSKIVFSSDRAVAGTDQLWIMNADGSNPVQVTTAAGMNRFHPSFDFDGTHVIYSGATPGNGQNMFIANIDGTNEMPLTTNADKYIEKMGTWVFAQ